MMPTRPVSTGSQSIPNLSHPDKGTVEVLSKSKRHPELWKNVLGSDNLTEPIGHSGRNWIACKYAVARSQEPCFPGSWVFFVDGAEVSVQPGADILLIHIQGGGGTHYQDIDTRTHPFRFGSGGCLPEVHDPWDHR
jgi:hypothetical protein